MLQVYNHNKSTMHVQTASTYDQEFFLGFMSSIYAGANLSVTVGTPGNSTQFMVETSDWNYQAQ